jgi:hydroxysqualene synthase
MQGVEHYENFPVASWLCPPRLRPPIAAIYHFARTADDLADEGDANAGQRLSDLATYRAVLQKALAGTCTPANRWAGVFLPLQGQIALHHLPAQPLHDLVSAFEQDVRYTAQGTRYTDMAQLLDYCQRSANPVGRLLLHLYGVSDAASLQQSDAICTALQLINFWQDLSVDLARQRHYLPLDLLHKHGVEEADLMGPDAAREHPAAQALLEELTRHARQLMLTGAPLALRLPGRTGWELRLVVQGGLCMLDKIAQQQHRTWLQRPKLSTSDLPRMVWRAATMRA